MIEPRIIRCAVCGEKCQETKYGEGWPGWGQLSGIALNGDENPYLCPEHLSQTADYVDSIFNKGEK